MNEDVWLIVERLESGHYGARLPEAASTIRALVARAESAERREDGATRAYAILREKNDAQAAEIERLRAEVHTVLTREAATIARYDAKLEAVESERDRLLYALKAKLDEDERLEQILRREP